ncbi:MAG: drug/metabolite transporter (DMT)-like permease [Alphaproteobacteria bacterium]|jgi:drug/metabolite transporter (DMT)-like permease
MLLGQVQVLQFVGAAFVFLALRLFDRGQKKSNGWTGLSVAAGVTGITATMVFQYIAFSYGPIAEVNLIAYSWPLVIAFCLVSIGAASRPIVTGLLALAGFVGVALIVDPLKDQSGAQGIGLGHLAAMASAFAMAGYSLIINRYQINQLDAHIAGSIVGAGLALVWCLLTTPSWNTDLTANLMAFYLGAGPIGVGYYFWARAMASKHVERVAIVGFLTPVFSTLLLVVSGEALSFMAIVGCAIVVGACVWISALEQEPAHDA